MILMSITINMVNSSIKISAWGNGLASILGVGSVLLALANNSAWIIFLLMAIIALAASILLRKVKL
jgi:hypothetical protein